MAGTVKGKKKLELIAGIITISVALLLLGATVLLMNKLTIALPGTTAPAYTPQTQQTRPTQPALIPNPYGPGDFVYDNGYLTCTSGESLLGVDVSEHQGPIDWDQVAGAGIDFAMVRLGFRGWGSTGNVLADARGLENLQGAKDAGLLVGVYFYSQAITVEEAKEEARFVLEQLDGQQLDLPIVYDWEVAPDADARTADMTAEMLNACAVAFCQEVEAAGYEPMVYFNLDIATRMLDLKQMQRHGYDFWLAMYTDQMTYPHRVHMWQYSSDGSVDGISGRVDMNLYFVYE